MIEQTITNQIQSVEPRTTVEMNLPDGRVFSGPRGIAVEKFLQALPEWGQTPIVGAVVNGELRELTYPITMECAGSTGDDGGCRWSTDLPPLAGFPAGNRI